MISLEEQIQSIIDILKEHGQPNSDGKQSITFGELLGKTHSDALNMTLRKAKKKGILTFDGEILMQGRVVSGRTPEADNDIPIVLLSEEIK
ncbi:hypothetical protein SERLA73DRAFT_175822 [Serpula lacrymans var. lacrymans S7.3]|uniref:Costars domain-containing protein n=2 Tax=Serpula lacrymans var. lacrymans TaxID=341189 RepID=F8PIX7_SERL3|nr:uncharacterized protein SERLADRAFT_458431 [Serpula lacrymans var. lacrymans S7.9]EGO04077.1 hypothetical protein SERLA73DRAFT_175822 [Serpula lacrymans var. lacrymans S7.3]EGO29997.1 hypothetical protein SERLADRAFT_458431 [Serpula lacrymans var. lacrymans S7.9]